MSKFEIEERYIVLKISKLGWHEQWIKSELERLKIPLTACVIVENDWPNYQQTCRDIQAVSEGCFTDSANRIAELEKALERTNVELSRTIDQVNHLFEYNHPSNSLDEPESWDKQTCHENQVLLRAEVK